MFATLTMMMMMKKSFRSMAVIRRTVIIDVLTALLIQIQLQIHRQCLTESILPTFLRLSGMKRRSRSLGNLKQKLRHSVNYAALLKEKEDHIAKLNQENGSLKQNLEVSNSALSATRNETSRTSTSSVNGLKASFEVNKLRQEVDDKESKLKQLEMELHRRGNGVNNTDNLRRMIANLEKENVELKAEKEKLESVLKDTPGAGKRQSDSLDESGHASMSFPGKVELEQSLQQIEKDLKETRRERDKAKQELARLKQHLLDKELEESEKRDEDSKIIEELQQHVEYQKATISNLERALGQARTSQEEIKIMNDHELQKSLMLKTQNFRTCKLLLDNTMQKLKPRSVWKVYFNPGRNVQSFHYLCRI